MINQKANVKFIHKKELSTPHSRYGNFPHEKHQWILSTDLPGYKNFQKHFYVTHDFYLGEAPPNEKTNTFLAYMKTQRYGNDYRYKSFDNLVDAKYYALNEFGLFVKTIEQAKDKVAEVNKIEKYKMSFIVSQTYRDWSKVKWYLQTTLPYMKTHLESFYAQTSLTREGEIRHYAFWKNRRSEKYLESEACDSIAEAKYVVIEKYNQFIEYYKKKNYFAR